MTAAGLSAVLMAAASCSPPEPGVSEQFGTSGELIAMSGAGAGATNACFTCHGLKGEGDGAGVPRLAGLDAGYLQHQLQAYSDGRRQNRSMRWIAKQLSKDEWLRVSHYYAALPWSPAQSRTVPPAPSLFVAGDPQRQINACASCHGIHGLGNGGAIPPLAGQPAAYIAQQLEDWRRGRRRSDPDNVMVEIARSLTSEEVSALAAYASALPGGRQRQEPAEGSPAGRRSDPRNGASALPRYVSGS